MKYLPLLLLLTGCGNESIVAPSALNLEADNNLSIHTGFASLTCDDVVPRYKTEVEGNTVTVTYRIETTYADVPMFLEVKWDEAQVVESNPNPQVVPLGIGTVFEGKVVHTYPSTDEPTEVKVRLDTRAEGYDGGCGRGRFVTINEPEAVIATMNAVNTCRAVPYISFFDVFGNDSGNVTVQLSDVQPGGFPRDPNCLPSDVTIKLYKGTELFASWNETVGPNEVVNSRYTFAYEPTGNERWRVMFESTTAPFRYWWAGGVWW